MNIVLLLLHQYFLAVHQLSTTNCQLVATTNWAVAALARSTVSVSPLQLVRLVVVDVVVAVALVSLVITQATIRKSREITTRRRRSSAPTHIFDKITMKLNYVSLTSLFASLSAVFICAQVWEYDRDQMSLSLSLSVCVYPTLFLKYNIELNYSP